MKKCTRCKVEKDLINFGINKKTKDGFEYQCKPCRKEVTEKWKSKNRERIRELDRQWRLKHPGYGKEQKKEYRETHKLQLKNAALINNFGITLQEYNKLLREQNYSCAICKVHFKKFTRALAVDHDHKCCAGKKSCGNCVRGLLCNNCNNLLGRAKDNFAILFSAAEYLKFYFEYER